jgi:hypothetical protein
MQKPLAVFDLSVVTGVIATLKAILLFVFNRISRLKVAKTLLLRFQVAKTRFMHPHARFVSVLSRQPKASSGVREPGQSRYPTYPSRR